MRPRSRSLLGPPPNFALLTTHQAREFQRESAENKRRCDTWSQTVAKLQEDGEQMLRALRKAEQREQEATAAEKKTQQAGHSSSFAANP
jgi:hypothetical protein